MEQRWRDDERVAGPRGTADAPQVDHAGEHQRDQGARPQLAHGALGRAGGPRSEHRHAAMRGGCRRRCRRAARHPSAGQQLIQGSDPVGHRRVVPGQDPRAGESGLLDDRREFLVVDDRGDVLTREHVGQLRPGEVGAERYQAAPEASRRHRGLHEPAVVPAHDPDGVLRRQPEALMELRRQPGCLVIELAERHAAELVDHGGPVGVELRGARRDSGRRRPVTAQRE